MTKIEHFQQQINDLIKSQQFDGNPRALYEPIAYAMHQGGKRLRPLLTMLACDLFGGNTEKALYPALAVEVFHNFTLVHDDIMDKAPLRRGKETVYKNGTRILPYFLATLCLPWHINIRSKQIRHLFLLFYRYLAKRLLKFAKVSKWIWNLKLTARLRYQIIWT